MKKIIILFIFFKLNCAQEATDKKHTAPLNCDLAEEHELKSEDEIREYKIKFIKDRKDIGIYKVRCKPNDEITKLLQSLLDVIRIDTIIDNLVLFHEDSYTRIYSIDSKEGWRPKDFTRNLKMYSDYGLKPYCATKIKNFKTFSWGNFDFIVLYDTCYNIITTYLDCF